MKLWRHVLALSVVWLLIALSSAAQSPSPSSAGSPTGTDSSTSVAPAPSTTVSEASKPESLKAPAKRKRSAPAISREQVMAVQQALKDKGYDPGKIDGAMGSKTRAAVQDFQRKEGLKVTGRIDSETIAKLGVSSAATAGSGTTQPGVAVKPTAGEPSSPAAAPAGTSANPSASGAQQLGEPKR